MSVFVRQLTTDHNRNFKRSNMQLAGARLSGTINNFERLAR
jgi:hypothetical protein